MSSVWSNSRDTTSSNESVTFPRFSKRSFVFGWIPKDTQPLLPGISSNWCLGLLIKNRCPVYTGFDGEFTPKKAVPGGYIGILGILPSNHVHSRFEATVGFGEMDFARADGGKAGSLACQPVAVFGPAPFEVVAVLIR